MTVMPAANPLKIAMRVKLLSHAQGLPLPAYQTPGAAGMDLFAALPHGRGMILTPGARRILPTGLCIELPMGFEAQLRPRSGLAAHHGVTVLNSPGTIDADYRGEILVILINHGDGPFEVRRGERIAQLVVQPVAHAVVQAVTELAASERGGSGLGSTGR